MLKRTAKHKYPDKMSRADALAGRPAGVTNDQEKIFARYLEREDREHRYEKKRLANAKRSGKGVRECLRRMCVPVPSKMLKFLAQQADVT